jgi:poly(3-hydroxybutyrate) depolymerase
MIMKYVLALFCLLLFLPQAYAASDDKIVKDSIASGGKKRTFYLYIPKSIKADKPAPLLVTLHGSGHNGLILVEKWKGLADKEGIILVGPGSGTRCSGAFRTTALTLFTTWSNPLKRNTRLIRDASICSAIRREPRRASTYLCLSRNISPPQSYTRVRSV